MSLLALIVSFVSSNANVLLISLVIVGFSYGSIIAVYPVAVIKIFGEEYSSQIYGRVHRLGVLLDWLAHGWRDCFTN